jgi:glycine/D-amino acid oxidase-like deaminating enzyme
LRPDAPYAAAVIGGGFYGAMVAVYLAKRRCIGNVVLIEREPHLFARSSYANQARVHNGYHYPRSFTTAYRSRVNYQRFLADWPEAVTQSFAHHYAVARSNSKVTARQFERFCAAIGASLAPASKDVLSLFDMRLIDRVFAVCESSFDSVKLRAAVERSMSNLPIDLVFSSRVLRVDAAGDGLLSLTTDRDQVRAHYVFNCTYSGLNQIGGGFGGTKAKLKHEVAEMALVRPPTALANLGITIMDGPFFSLMPFPSVGSHILSHVRYTPHRAREDEQNADPYVWLASYEKEPRADRMIRDAARYIPALSGAMHVSSLFEVKTVLVKSEGDDGRPILLETAKDLPNFYSVLGGKIDNVYDVLEALDSEAFQTA